jgi:hypothetical protein
MLSRNTTRIVTNQKHLFFYITMDHFHPDFPGKPHYRHLIPRIENYSAGFSPPYSRRPQNPPLPLNFRARMELLIKKTPLQKVVQYSLCYVSYIISAIGQLRIQFTLPSEAKHTLANSSFNFHKNSDMLRPKFVKNRS